LQSLIDDLIEEDGSDNPLGIIRPEQVDIRRLLDSLAIEAEGLALANGNTFTWLPGSRLPALVLVDPKRLRQVLINLLDNAAKFTRGGRVVFQADAICNEEAASCVFKVIDTGIGMSIDQLSQLFEPYQRAESSLGVAGMGLGLAIARHWLERLGGRITVDSAPGQGTTMEVTLPMQTPDPSSLKPAPPEKPSLGALRPDAATLEEAQHYLLLGAVSELLEWSRVLEHSCPQWRDYAKCVESAAQRQDLAELRSLLLDRIND
jgi:light-regulated signal transduction histidine kinase (bacteriophytochrome)